MPSSTSAHRWRSHSTLNFIRSSSLQPRQAHQHWNWLSPCWRPQDPARRPHGRHFPLASRRQLKRSSVWWQSWLWWTTWRPRQRTSSVQLWHSQQLQQQPSSSEHLPDPYLWKSRCSQPPTGLRTAPCRWTEAANWRCWTPAAERQPPSSELWLPQWCRSPILWNSQQQ
jgi:hypothetical protein